MKGHYIFNIAMVISIIFALVVLWDIINTPQNLTPKVPTSIPITVHNHSEVINTLEDMQEWMKSVRLFVSPLIMTH